MSEPITDERLAELNILRDMEVPSVDDEEILWDAFEDAFDEVKRLRDKYEPTPPADPNQRDLFENPLGFDNLPWECADPDCSMTNFGKICTKCGRSKT